MIHKISRRITSLALLFSSILATITVLGCLVPVESPTTTTVPVGAPQLTATFPVNDATDIAINSTVRATFDQNMDFATVVAANFSLVAGASTVTGVVTYDSPNKVARFSPSSNLLADTVYTATISTQMTNLPGTGISSSYSWSFTTAPAGIGPSAVNLGSAGQYVILAKTAISTVPSSVITGDVGLSPAAESFMTGFSQTKATGYSTSPQITGFMYAADMTPPTPTYMTTAISDMETAYTDAAGRLTPDFLDMWTGDISGQILAPGLYKWNSTVTVPGNVTISGGANDVWIFQVTGDLSVANDSQIILGGSAQAKNIFWQITGQATLGTDSHFEGIILSQTAVTFQTGTTMNGRAFAQSQIALAQTTITQPAP